MGPAAGCCQRSYLRLWSHEPWGYPARTQAAILSLKFPTGGSKDQQAGLTRLYRLLFAIGWTFWVFYSVFGKDGNPTPTWTIYVTHWTAALMGGYAWAALISTLLPRIRWLDTAAWFLHGVTAPLTVMVTVLFWATYEPPADGGDSGDLPSNPITVHTHGVNALLMLMDLAVSRYPYHLKHFPSPLAFILAYLLFNFTYWTQTRVVVYPSLNYDHPVGALIMIAATLFGLLPATHLLLWRFELACFALSERRRLRAALQGFWLAKGLSLGGRDVEAAASGPPVVKGAAAADAADAAVAVDGGGVGEISDAALATRRVVAAFDEAEEAAALQTPSTAGSWGLGVSGSGSGDETLPAAAMAVGAA